MRSTTRYPHVKVRAVTAAPARGRQRQKRNVLSHQPSRVQTCPMATPFTPEQVAWLQSVFGTTGLPAPGVPSKTSAAGERTAPSPGTAANMAQVSTALLPSSSGEQGDMRARRALAGGAMGGSLNSLTPLRAPCCQVADPHEPAVDGEQGLR